MTSTQTSSNYRWVRPAGWSLAAALLLLPLIATLVTGDMAWGFGDFILAALLIGAVGVAMELAMRIPGRPAYRVGMLIAAGTAFLLTWSNLAVGYIGNEDNSYNLWFFGVVAIALGGSILGLLRARFMALAMLLAGVAHAVVGAIGFAQDTRTGPITLVFVCLWLGAARLFQKAAREQG